jgi:AraC-like DNA-binding protein
MQDLSLESAVTASRRSTAPDGGQLATLVSVMCLLRDARAAIRRDADQARQCLEQAATLLQETIPGAEDRDASLPPRRCPLAPWQVSRVRTYIEARLSERIAIEDLAAQARLSVSYFSRAFRSTVGMPPHAYLVRRRIEYACEMIRSTDKPLSEIALDCGLADQAHLGRHFRRVVGTSPAAWRRLHGRAPEPEPEVEPEAMAWAS